MPAQSDVIEKLLALLRRWGWEAGSEKLELELGTGGTDPGPEVAAFFKGWLAAERGEYDVAEAQVQKMATTPVLAGWALVVQAFIAMRRKEYELALRLLNEADQKAPADLLLAAAILHLRGTTLFHQGKGREGLALLRRARQTAGDDHFAFGRTLDAMGMIYGNEGNFHAARAFYCRALEHKEKWDDTAGLAVTHGQLGRLYLEWGLLKLAEREFKQDLALCEQIDDPRGHAQISNALGQVALARGDGKTAAQWFDAALRECEGKVGWEVIEGYAHKDRALAFIAAGSAQDLVCCEEHLSLAERCFKSLGKPFDEGLAHVNRAWGTLQRLRGRWNESRQHLRDALKHFFQNDVLPDVAKTQLEMARTQRARGDSGEPVLEAVRQALKTAEESRRPDAVRMVERELMEVDPAAYYSRLHERARGNEVKADPTSLIEGESKTGTVMFLDLKGSTEITAKLEPDELMLMLNQLMAEMTKVLTRYKGQVICFRGDGFLALFLEENHARRAVDAALDMNPSLEVFNEPRRELGLPLFQTRVGISTGEMCLGNIGTYHKLDYSAVGKATNLGARLEPEATPGVPCISEQTHARVGDRYAYCKPEGREVQAKGFSEKVRVWDVCGWKEGGTAAGGADAGK